LTYIKPPHILIYKRTVTSVRKQNTAGPVAMKKKRKSRILENIEAVALAFIIAAVVRSFIFDNYVVPTGSMIPTIETGDRLIGFKMLYGSKIPFTGRNLPPIRDPEYGDVVVFLSPFYERPGLAVRIFGPAVYALSLGFITIDTQPKYFVKRCIGLPGDEVEIKKREVYINGKLQKGWWPEYHTDPHTVPRGKTPAGRRDFFGPCVIPPDSYFMLGDNRDNSNDSRYWGFVQRGQIYACVLFRYWPINRFGRVR
jgi:signal peptidase I